MHTAELGRLSGLNKLGRGKDLSVSHKLGRVASGNQDALLD